MTKREIAFLFCRLMAVYLFMSSVEPLLRLFNNGYLTGVIAKSIAGVPVGVPFTSYGTPVTPLNTAVELILTLIPAILIWISGFSLWIFAREIAVRLFENGPDEREEPSVITLGADVRGVAFGCVGLFYLIQDAPKLVLWLIAQIWDVLRWTRSAVPFGYGTLSWEWLVRVPLCLWLVFGLRGLAGLWRMAQEKGIAPTASSASTDALDAPPRDNQKQNI